MNIEHHIQRHIMRSLLGSPAASFSQLKPPGIESNLFLYHLNQLIKLGLVEKTVKQYGLTLTGKQHADSSTLQTMELRVQPKVITILVLINSQGQYLILERHHQPFLGTKGFPSGKVHFGEQLEQAAYRELHEKSALTDADVNLKLRGNIIMRFHRQDSDEIVSHIIGYVFSGSIATASDQHYEQPYFRSYWGEEDLLHQGDSFKGHAEILQLLQRPDYFIESFDFVSSF